MPTRWNSEERIVMTSDDTCQSSRDQSASSCPCADIRLVLAANNGDRLLVLVRCDATSDDGPSSKDRVEPCLIATRGALDKYVFQCMLQHHPAAFFCDFIFNVYVHGIAYTVMPVWME